MDNGPRRTCTGCRARRPQDEMVRVVRAPSGIRVASDWGPGERPPGRGAYVCRKASCVEGALASGALRRALRYDRELPEGLRSELLREVDEEGTDG